MSDHTLRPFVTGSHAYGLPSTKSDIDLVVFVTATELDQLSKCADEDLSYNAPGYYQLGCRSYRFGGLNMLCCVDENVYRVWWEGTRALKKMKPVSREYACRYMKERRLAAGIGESYVEEPPPPRGPREEEIPF